MTDAILLECWNEVESSGGYECIANKDRSNGTLFAFPLFQYIVHIINDPLVDKYRAMYHRFLEYWNEVESSDGYERIANKDRSNRTLFAFLCSSIYNRWSGKNSLVDKYRRFLEKGGRVSSGTDSGDDSSRAPDLHIIRVSSVGWKDGWKDTTGGWLY